MDEMVEEGWAWGGSVLFSLAARGLPCGEAAGARDSFRSGSSHHVREFPAAIFNGKAWTSIGAGTPWRRRSDSAAASLELPAPRHSVGFSSFAFESVRQA